MLKQFFPAARLLLVLTIIVGGFYPLGMTLIAQVAFPAQANGSLVQVDGVTVGSSLIGQTTNDPRYFWSRPSAVDTMLNTSLDNLGSSGATNYGATSDTLTQMVEEREAAFREANQLSEDTAVPVEMLFASGSGLDPHISPEAARLQIDRIAAERGLDRMIVSLLVEQYIETPQLGFLGQPRVNALQLNLALDGLQ